MVFLKTSNKYGQINEADTAEAPICVTRPQRTAALLADKKIRDLPKKLSDFPIYKFEDTPEVDNFNIIISSLPVKSEKVTSSTSTTKPTREGATADSSKCESSKRNIDDIATRFSDQPASVQAKRQKIHHLTDAPNKTAASGTDLSQPCDATAIWKSVRGQTAAEKRDLRKQQKERLEKMEFHKKTEQEARLKNDKIKFMFPSFNEIPAGSLSDEDESEAEAYAMSVGARFDAVAGAYQSAGSDRLIPCKYQEQMMESHRANEAPQRYEICSSPRKPQSPEAKVGNESPDEDMANEDGKSPLHNIRPQRPKMSHRKLIFDDQADENGDENEYEESPPHLRKSQHGRPKGDKVVTAIELDEDDKEGPHKRTSEYIRSPSSKAMAAAVNIEDEEDFEELPPRNRRASHGRQPKAAKTKARLAHDDEIGDIVKKLPPPTRGHGGHPPKAAAKAKTRVVESEDEEEEEEEEEEDMVVFDKSPPRFCEDHRAAAAARRTKAKLEHAPRIDPYHEAALYTSYAGLRVNAPNKTLDKARTGEGLGHRKHK